MKALSMAIIVFAFLGSLVAGLQVFETARGNWIPAVTMDVKSPVNEKTYRSSPLLEVAVDFYYWGNRSKWVTYSIDGGANRTLTGTLSEWPGSQGSSIHEFRASAVLPLMSEGQHRVAVFAWVDAEDSPFADSTRSSSEITFYISQQEPSISLPRVEILSPENNTHCDTEVSLKLTVNTSASWVGYSLDDQANVTLENSNFMVSAEILLTGLTVGAHNLVVFANDTAGNMGRSDTVFFTVNTQPSPSPSPTPTLSPSPSMPTAKIPSSNPPYPVDPTDLTPYYGMVGAAASATIITVVIAYFKKNKKEKLS